MIFRLECFNKILKSLLDNDYLIQTWGKEKEILADEERLISSIESENEGQFLQLHYHYFIKYDHFDVSCTPSPCETLKRKIKLPKLCFEMLS